MIAGLLIGLVFGIILGGGFVAMLARPYIEGDERP